MNRRSWSRLSPAWRILLLLPLLGADTPAPSDPLFVAQSLDGKSTTGRIRQITPQGEFILVATDGKESTRPIATLFKLARPDAHATLSAPEGGVILFPEGDRLHRAIVGSSGETNLTVQAPFGQIALPLDSLLGVILSPPPQPEALDALMTRIRSEPRKTEVAWLANGDKVAGGLLGLDDKKVSIQVDGKPVELDRMGVQALGFDPSLAVYPMPEGPYIELTLLDGSRLGVTGPRLEQGHIAATTRFGGALRVPLGEVARIHARHRGIAYLSERDPARTLYTPYGGPVRKFKRDRAVDDGPIRLGGQVYDRGLGTQSRTWLVYPLSPGDRRFQATVGLDDRAGPLGSVQFQVLVDTNLRFSSETLSAGDAPVAVDVDLTGGRYLILKTEFGERGDVRDLADWAEARIIRDETAGTAVPATRE